MVFSAIRSGKGVKSQSSNAVLSSVPLGRPILVIAAAAVLSVMAMALIAFVSIGG